jgi:hypothetical protein
MQLISRVSTERLYLMVRDPLFRFKDLCEVVPGDVDGRAKQDAETKSPEGGSYSNQSRNCIAVRANFKFKTHTSQGSTYK